MPDKLLICLVAPLFALALAGCASPEPARDGSAPKPASRDTVITNIGSDTIVNLALAWAEKYATVRPEVRISVTGGGSGTGISSLIAGTADIANASRSMKPEEREQAQARRIGPREVVIARDAIAVIVHRDNPVKELTIDQLSDIFSGKIRNWRQVGGEDRPIVRLSREVNSGTHVYFLEAVVRKGKSRDKTLFSRDTLLLPSSEGITSEVAQNPNAIGYDGLGYVTDHVKVVAVSGDGGKTFVAPSAKSVVDGTYPISRELFMYVQEPPAPRIATYLEWIRSAPGQAIVEELGFVPITGPAAAADATR